MVKIMDNLLYTKSHEWVKVDGEIATIGVTDYAQHELGDIVHVELPDVGDEVACGDEFTSIEAVKAVEDIYSPVSGEITEINEALEDDADLINKSAYEDGWIVKIKMSNLDELKELLDAKAYAGIVEE